MAQGTVAAISLGLIAFVVIVLVLGIYELHSLPGRVAARRSHPQTHAIEVCSVLGLLVFPLWMAALVWAYAGTLGTPLPEASEPPAVATSNSAVIDDDDSQDGTGSEEGEA
jgi:hypothetical protein